MSTQVRGGPRHGDEPLGMNEPDVSAWPIVEAPVSVAMAYQDWRAAVQAHFTATTTDTLVAAGWAEGRAREILMDALQPGTRFRIGNRIVWNDGYRQMPMQEIRIERAEADPSSKGGAV